jgi:taurine dioxygenase
VLRFPDQHLDLSELKRFSEQFGEIQGPATRGRDPTQEYPEIDILSNLKEGGKYIGSPDAGQDWHTDMTYREVPGFVNVLYGIRIPHREGKPLGGARGQAGWPSFAIRARPNLGKIRNDGSAGDAVLWSCR